MTTAARTVLRNALRLPAVERAELIDALFRSLEKAGDPRLDRLWADEAESRIDAYDSGRMTASPASAVLRRISRR